jgi:hypothetical protein
MRGVASGRWSATPDEGMGDPGGDPGAGSFGRQQSRREGRGGSIRSAFPPGGTVGVEVRISPLTGPGACERSPRTAGAVAGTTGIPPKYHPIVPTPPRNARRAVQVPERQRHA